MFLFFKKSLSLIRSFMFMVMGNNFLHLVSAASTTLSSPDIVPLTSRSFSSLLSQSLTTQPSHQASNKLFHDVHTQFLTMGGANRVSTTSRTTSHRMGTSGQSERLGGQTSGIHRHGAADHYASPLSPLP
jgi:hypothetical protein